MMLGMSWTSNFPSPVSCLLIGLGASGVMVLYHHRCTLSHRLLSWRIKRLLKISKKQVHVVSSEEEWTTVLPLLEREVQREGAVGLDCEWVRAGGQRRPVALLQLASRSGVCVLVRLSALKQPLPTSLKNFLEDVKILKAGVGVGQDGNFLAADYGLKVQSCIDLRHLVLDCYKFLGQGKVSDTPGLGLAALSDNFLGHTLDKAWQVRASDWEAKVLTERQVNYGAEDALVGVQLLLVLWAKLWFYGREEGAGKWLLPILPPPLFSLQLTSSLHHICCRYLNLQFSNTKLRQGNGSASQLRSPAKVQQSAKAYPLLKSPLYHNCQLLAPDDVPLCTCDPKKARWYVEKGLGVVVQQDPLTVRLNFEPAGRPRLEYEDEMYYTQERQNHCVVCGQGHSFVRKNVVPHEYRKHFPNILKDHQSHDVVLLCVVCHSLSNSHDVILKNILAKECNAPIGQESNCKVTVDTSRKAVRNAAGALVRSRPNIPEPRIHELEKIIKNYFKVEDITQDVLQEAANMDANNWNEGYRAHGLLVCEAYQKRGLVHLLQRWRKHFLDVMQPQYLPQGWSITHSFRKMNSIMAQLPHHHPDYQTYKMILVGTEGSSDNLCFM